ncbi:DUF4307 domain-containing protein [Mycolicibacterium sp.]|uniref:DUF4307 domain-containing protein n=1 Tax=Mycolicibacterium sp. TaxID=2320850 RepID=UPI001A3256C5|nr:DUF4307 domain-containing protein [Mycolicibacterium sp.]MBJ7399807.1 DUF4307 domain-containing protein [Mycolicibacterium sp.]
MAEMPLDAPLESSRYGRAPMAPATGRRAKIAVTALAIAAGLAVAAIGYQRFTGSDVDGKMAAYEVLDNQTVSVTISVTRKDPGTPVVCIVRARSKDGAETGRREILVGASEAKTVQVTTTVKSYRQPLMGDIYGCGTDVPQYLQAG